MTYVGSGRRARPMERAANRVRLQTATKWAVRGMTKHAGKRSFSFSCRFSANVKLQQQRCTSRTRTFAATRSTVSLLGRKSFLHFLT
jgi:hypothetical protein